MTIKTFAFSLLAVAVFGLLSYFLGYNAGLKSTPSMRDTIQVVKSDTVYLPASPSTIIKTVVKRDTVLVFQDTVVRTEIATLDTAVAEGKLKVDYYLTPSIFRLMWKPKTIMTIRDTIRVRYPVSMTIPKKWYEQPSFLIPASMLAGLGAGVAISNR